MLVAIRRIEGLTHLNVVNSREAEADKIVEIPDGVYEDSQKFYDAVMEAENDNATK